VRARGTALPPLSSSASSCCAQRHAAARRPGAVPLLVAPQRPKQLSSRGLPCCHPGAPHAAVARAIGPPYSPSGYSSISSSHSSPPRSWYSRSSLLLLLLFLLHPLPPLLPLLPSSDRDFGCGWGPMSALNTRSACCLISAGSLGSFTSFCPLPFPFSPFPSPPPSPLPFPPPSPSPPPLPPSLSLPPSFSFSLSLSLSLAPLLLPRLRRPDQPLGQRGPLGARAWSPLAQAQAQGGFHFPSPPPLPDPPSPLPPSLACCGLVLVPRSQNHASPEARKGDPAF